MIRFKIFFGTYGTVAVNTAENKINDWLKRNPDVYVLDWQYQQARMGDHSICIRYDDCK